MAIAGEVGFWGRTKTPREIAWSFWHNYIMEGFDGVPLDETRRHFFSKNIGTL